MDAISSPMDVDVPSSSYIVQPPAPNPTQSKQPPDATLPPVEVLPSNYTLPEDLPKRIWTDTQIRAHYGINSNKELLGSWERELPIYAEEANWRKWCTSPIALSRPNKYRAVNDTTMDNAMTSIRLFLGFAYKFAKIPRQKLSLVLYSQPKVFILVRCRDASEARSHHQKPFIFVASINIIALICMHAQSTKAVLCSSCICLLP